MSFIKRIAFIQMKPNQQKKTANAKQQNQAMLCQTKTNDKSFR